MFVFIFEFNVKLKACAVKPVKSYYFVYLLISKFKDNQKSNTYYYRVFGLPIESEIELRALHSDNDDEDTASTTILESNEKPILVTIGSASEPFSREILHDGGWYRFNHQEFCYEMPNVVRFLVRNGNQIIIEPLCDDWDQILLFFYSNAIAAVMFQRGLTPFHVSGVLDSSGRVWLFSAASKVGKSTTAIMLKERGYQLFTDDTALFKVIKGKAKAVASYPMVRIWSQTLKKQQVFDVKQAYQMREDIDKYGILFHDVFEQNPVEIAGIVFLNNQTYEMEIEELTPLKAFSQLRQNVYRNNWVSKMGLEAGIYQLITNILSQVPAYVAYRPKNKISFDEFAEMIDDQIIQNN